jgi:hypothetical protein
MSRCRNQDDYNLKITHVHPDSKTLGSRHLELRCKYKPSHGFLRRHLIREISTSLRAHDLTPHPRTRDRWSPYIFYYYFSGGETEFTRYCGHYWPIVPASDDKGNCGAIGGMNIGRGNRSTPRKPAPVPLCPLQIPHDLTWARTRAAAVGSQRLTAWAMARQVLTLLLFFIQSRFHVTVFDHLAVPSSHIFSLTKEQRYIRLTLYCRGGRNRAPQVSISLQVSLHDPIQWLRAEAKTDARCYITHKLESIIVDSLVSLALQTHRAFGSGWPQSRTASEAIHRLQATVSTHCISPLPRNVTSEDAVPLKLCFLREMWRKTLPNILFGLKNKDRRLVLHDDAITTVRTRRYVCVSDKSRVLISGAE